MGRAAQIRRPDPVDRDRADVVTEPGLHREVVHARHHQQVAALRGRRAHDVEQLALGEVAVGDQQYVHAVTSDLAVEVGEPAELRDDRLRDAVVSVVDEADYRQRIARMPAQDLRQLGGERSAADQHRAVSRDPAAPAQTDQPRRSYPADDNEPDRDRDVHQEGGDRLLLVPQRDHRGDHGGSGEQPAQQRGQLVENAEVQPRSVPGAPGEQEQPQQSHRQVGAPLLRCPQHGGRQQHGVDRQDEHPRPHPDSSLVAPDRLAHGTWWSGRRGAGTEVPSVTGSCDRSNAVAIALECGARSVMSTESTGQPKSWSPQNMFDCGTDDVAVVFCE